MNFLNKCKIFFSTLFNSASNADKIILGQSIDGDEKTIPIQQVKDTKRVADKLLKGEVTQEVKELRYRDYLVSEHSRHYTVTGDEATKNSRISYSPNKFGGMNHEITGTIEDAINDNKTNYTLKINYDGIPRFNLIKYCTHFYVDLTKRKLLLYFDLMPNRNVATSKSFLNYVQSTILSSRLGGDFSIIPEIWFVSYKITAVQNFLKFTFKDLILNKIDQTDKEIVFEYTITKYTIDDLIEKYKVDELEQKYKTNARKHLPEDISTFNIIKCSICGKTITDREAEMNKEVCGELCCSDCMVTELTKNKEK